MVATALNKFDIFDADDNSNDNDNNAANNNNNNDLNMGADVNVEINNNSSIPDNIQANNNNGNQNDIYSECKHNENVHMKPNMCYNTMRKYADIIISVLFAVGKANFASMIRILDMISSCLAMKDDLKGIKIRECISTMIEMKNTFNKFRSKKDKTNRMQKQILLSAMAIVESTPDIEEKASSTR